MAEIRRDVQVGDIIQHQGRLARVVKVTHLPPMCPGGVGPTVQVLEWYEPEKTPQQLEAERLQNRERLRRLAENIRDDLLAKAQLAQRREMEGGTRRVDERPPAHHLPPEPL